MAKRLIAAVVGYEIGYALMVMPITAPIYAPWLFDRVFELTTSLLS